MGGSAVDSVDNSPQTPSCPRYPQPYAAATWSWRFFEHLRITVNTASSDTNFWGEPQGGQGGRRQPDSGDVMFHRERVIVALEIKTDVRLVQFRVCYRMTNGGGKASVA
jgi:hypothetical protein